MSGASEAAISRARDILLNNGGMLRTRDALAQGIHPRTLYAMRDAGVLECLARGLYRLTELEPMVNPDLSIVAARIPKGVVCLISALDYHGMTTQIPHDVDIALNRDEGPTPPRLEWPPIDVWWYGGEAYSAGIETHRIDGVDVKIYNVEKTLADCFKYRNKLWPEVVIEALRMYRYEHKMNIPELIRYARICRVDNVMRPYVEALL